MISSKYVECEYCVKSMSDMLLGTNISNMIAFSSTYLEASRSATKSQKCCVKLSRCELEYTIPYSGKFRGMKVSQMIFCNFFCRNKFRGSRIPVSHAYFGQQHDSVGSHCHSNRLFISGH